MVPTIQPLLIQPLLIQLLITQLLVTQLLVLVTRAKTTKPASAGFVLLEQCYVHRALGFLFEAEAKFIKMLAIFDAYRHSAI